MCEGSLECRRTDFDMHEPLPEALATLQTIAEDKLDKISYPFINNKDISLQMNYLLVNREDNLATINYPQLLKKDNFLPKNYLITYLICNFAPKSRLR